MARLKCGLRALLWMVAGGMASHASAASQRAETLHALPLDRFIDATSLETLVDFVVTDTKIAQATDSVTQKIVVLREADIERQPRANHNLADLLRYTSGQFVNVLSRNDANWGAYAGLGPKYNTYLLDGLPIDSFADAIVLDSDAFERIEVHKGPASVLYSNYLTMDFAGNETALAGTTNFVLRNRVETPATRASLGTGSWSTMAGRASTRGRSGALSYQLGGSAESSDYTRYGVPDSWLETLNDPRYELTRLYGNLGLDLGRVDHTVSLFLHHADHDGTAGRPNRDFNHRYDTLNFSYQNHFADAWHFQFKAGQRDYDRQFDNDAYPASTDLARHDRTRQRIRPMDLTLSYRHGGDNLLSFGMDNQTVRYRTASRDPMAVEVRENDIQAESTGLFLQEKVHWSDWILRAGIRHNRLEHRYALLGGAEPETKSAEWSKTLWSLGMRYNLSSSLGLYANLGSSFMAPAAKQIGGTVHVPGASGELANPALRPENGLGRDFGVDWRLSERLSFDARVFLNTIDDAIVSNVVSVAPSQTRSENAGRARALGIELDLRYVPNERLAWFANVTGTATRLRNTDDADQDGTAIPFSPDAIFNFGALTTLPTRTEISLYYHWVGRYYDSASRANRRDYGHYGILNMRVRHPFDERMAIVVDLNNLTDSRHDMPFEFRDPGFNLFAGLDLKR